MSQNAAGLTRNHVRLADRLRALFAAGTRRHAADSAALATGYVAQLAFQMAYFLVLTRMLGPDWFGRFAAALAAINLASPLAGLGFGEVALLRVSQDRKSTGRWTTNATAITAISGFTIAAVLALAAAVLVSNQWLPWQMMLALAINELVLVRCCHVAARIHQARREILRTSAINVSVAALKAAVAAAIFFAGPQTLESLVFVLLLSFAPLAVYVVASLFSRAPATGLNWNHLRSDCKLAFSFASGTISKAVYTDLDKLFLARWQTSFVVGTYAAGYKLLALSFMPIRAVLEATFSRQVELAENDRQASRSFTTKLFCFNTAAAATISVTLYALAPLATLVFGTEYEESIDVIRIGCFLPLLQSVHYTLGNHLTATGRQHVRTVVQIFVVAIYVITAMYVIATYSWKGAIYTSLACEALLMFLFAIACLSTSPRDASGMTIDRKQPTEGTSS